MRHRGRGRCASLRLMTSEEERAEVKPLRRACSTRLSFQPARNAKLRLIEALPAADARSRPRLGAGGADRRARLPRGQAALLRSFGEDKIGAGAVPSLLRLCRRPRRDAGADLGDQARGRPAADARRGRRDAAARHQDADAGDPQALARCARFDRPLGAAEAADRRAARRRLGAARQAGGSPISATSRSRGRGSLARALRRPIARCSTGC